MVNYYWVTFIPGAGGNFFSRCLNFAEDSVCFAHPRLGIPTTAEQKFMILSYNSVIGKAYHQRNWKTFESRVIPYRNSQHKILQTNRIWYTHPDDSVLNQGFVQPNDNQVKIYIDPEDIADYCLLQALYKNSYIVVDWLKKGVEYQKDDNFKKFKFKDMLDKGFVDKFMDFAHEIGLNYSTNGKHYVEKLHSQWLTTLCANTDNWKSELGL